MSQQQLNNSIYIVNLQIKQWEKQNVDLNTEICKARAALSANRNLLVASGVAALFMIMITAWELSTRHMENNLEEFVRDSIITVCGLFGTISAGVFVKKIVDYKNTYKSYKSKINKFNENKLAIELNKKQLKLLQSQDAAMKLAAQWMQDFSR